MFQFRGGYDGSEVVITVPRWLLRFRGGCYGSDVVIAVQRWLLRFRGGYCGVELGLLWRPGPASQMIRRVMAPWDRYCVGRTLLQRVVADLTTTCAVNWLRWVFDGESAKLRQVPRNAVSSIARGLQYPSKVSLSFARSAGPQGQRHAFAPHSVHEPRLLVHTCAC